MKHLCSIAGCFYGEGENGTELALGETADDEHLRHFCEESQLSDALWIEVEGSSGRVRYRVQAVKCKHNDELYEEGQSWAAEHLKYLCKENGAIAIINCLTANGTEIAVGQAIVEDEKLHRCFRVGATVYYQANACPANSALCTSGVPLYRPPSALARNEYPLRLRSAQGPSPNPFLRRPFFAQKH